jgi:hypothetical protein
MSVPDPEQLMYRLVGKAEEINSLAVALLDDGPGLFEAVSQRMPKFVPAELGFLRLVSWLYVLCWEAGKVNLAFLTKHLDAYGLDPDGKIRMHLSNVQGLRTYTQHNLNSEEAHDKETMGKCHAWFSGQCGTAVPDSDDEWRRCVLALLEESVVFLEMLLSALRLIEKDESREMICKDWKFRRNRYHPPHQFEALFPTIAADMGCEYIDTVRLVRRNYERWTQSLRAFSSEYDFETEARKLIENAILVELPNLLPITGQDLIREFELEPGKLVGRLLEEARGIYQRAPCSRMELLDRLRPIAATLAGGPAAA